MGAGPKRHRIRIQQRTLILNELGEEIEKWLDGEELWASVESLRGEEFFKGQTFFGSFGHFPQKQANIDARIRIRYREGLNPAENRIVHKGIAYNLLAVLQDNKLKETQLMVQAVSKLQDDFSTVNK